MNTRTCKAKGRRLQNKVAEDLRKTYCNHHPQYLVFNNSGGSTTSQQLKDVDIKPAIMGESGRDIKLTPAAEVHIPFDIECKNCETWSIPSWWKQTNANTKEGRLPLLIIKKNHHEELAVLKWSDLLKLMR